MSTFSDVLTEYINTKTSRLPYDQILGIDRSTMYKLISGKRNPPSKDIFEKMALFMHLTPAETQRFEEAWEVTSDRSGSLLQAQKRRKFYPAFSSHSSVSPDEFIFFLKTYPE